VEWEDEKERVCNCCW